MPKIDVPSGGAPLMTLSKELLNFLVLLCQTRLDIGGISVLQALAACLSCSRLMRHVDTRECPLFLCQTAMVHSRWKIRCE